MAENVIKSYLVRLNFDIDQPAFRRIDQVMAQAEASVERHTSGMAKYILQSQLAIVGGFTAISTAIVSMSDKVAMADQKYRLLGTRLMVTTESARKMSMISKLLGTTLEEASYDPESSRNWMVLAKHFDTMSESLGFHPGGKGEAALKGIREFHTAFSLFSGQLQFLQMGFVSSLFQKLFPDGGVAAMDKVSKWLTWFEQGIPRWSDKLAEYAVPVLRKTWLIFQDLGEVIKQGGLAFTNLVGALSGDQAIEGTEFKFENLAKALEHTANAMKRVEDAFIDFEKAAGRTATGDFSGALKALSGETQKATAQRNVDEARAALAAAKTPADRIRAQETLTDAERSQQENNNWIWPTLMGGIAVNTGFGIASKIAKVTGLTGAGKWAWRAARGLFGAAGARAGAAAAAEGGAAEGVINMTKLGSEWILPAAEGAEAGGIVSLLGPGALLALLGAVFAKPDWVAKYTLDKWFPGNAARKPAAVPGAKLGAAAGGVPGGVASAIEAAAASSGVPLSLLQAVAKAESNNNPNAVSPAGARGLMQLMPATGAAMGMTDPFDASQSANAGASYLAQLYRRYGSWRTALIAYNQGPDALKKYGAYPSAAAYADRILRESGYGRPSPFGGKGDVTNNISLSLGGIYITRPNAEPHQIQRAVTDGVRNALRGQSQFDLAQVAPA